MEKLIEQLQRNTEALNSLKWRYNDRKDNPSYLIFHTQKQRIEEMDWIIKVQKRVLRMRYRILENLNSETIKEMQSTSTKTRELNLKAA